MGKLLFWIVVIGLAWVAWSLFVVSQRKQERSGEREPPDTPGGRSRVGTAGGQRARSASAPEEMVACARCGVFLPASDSIAGRKGGRYCCVEHRDGGRG